MRLPIVFSTLFLIMVLNLFGCASISKLFLKDPEVNVIAVKTSGISLTDISIDILVNVKNPNQIELNLDSLNYKLNLAGETVIDGEFNSGIIVPAEGQQNITIPVKFRFNSLGAVLNGIIQKTIKKEYEFTANAEMGGFFKGLTIPFSQKGELNLSR